MIKIVAVTDVDVARCVLVWAMVRKYELAKGDVAMQRLYNRTSLLFVF
jgi:hypothetical protein